METIKNKSKKGYWIHFTIYECVLCGHTDTFQERIYDRPKPEDYYKRYKLIQTACGIHFC